MTDWKDVRHDPPPKDRIILVSNGWAWRREDVHRPAWRGLPATHDKLLKVVGSALLVHWTEAVHEHLLRLDGGAWVLIATGEPLFQAFRFWAEIDNPLTQSDLDAVGSTDLVGNVVPDVETMVPHDPRAARTDPAADPG